MKKTIALILALLALLLPFCIGVSAQGEMISAGLFVIQERTQLIKSAVSGERVSFTKEDFTAFLGEKNLTHVTVTSLPSVKDGVLKLMGLDVLSGQTISLSNASHLEFIPINKKVQSACFSFKNTNGGGEYTCIIKFTSEKNSAPSVKDQSVKTYKNVTVFGDLDASDADGDEVTYEILREPSSGVLFVDKDGSFVYKPKSGFMGTDSILYKAVDCYGNTSETAEIDIEISKPYRNIYYVDMIEHPQHSAALTLTKIGTVDLVLNEDGFPVFDPERTLTRKEFLVWAMRAAGLDDGLEDVESTFFLDDGLMDENDRMYVMKAYSERIISGISTENGVCFEPDEAITQLQAAVIVSRILKLCDKAEFPVFSEDLLIPAWAQSEINALVGCDVISEKSEAVLRPDTPLTKAEGAELLCSMINYKEGSDAGFFASLFK